MADVEKNLVIDIIDGDSGEILRSEDITVSLTCDPPGYGEGIYPEGEYGL